MGLPLKKLKTSHSFITNDLVPTYFELAAGDANVDVDQSVGLTRRVPSFVDLTRKDEDARCYDEEPLDFRGEENLGSLEASYLVSNLFDDLSLDDGSFLAGIDFKEGEFDELLQTDITVPPQSDAVMSVPSTVVLPSHSSIEHPSIGVATVTPEEQQDSKNIQVLDNTAANQLAFPGLVPQHEPEDESNGNEMDQNENVVIAQVRFSSASERTYIKEQDIAQNDILCGREFTGTHHEGNRIFLHSIRERLAIYDSYGHVHGSKTELTRDLLENYIQGRFIARESKSGRLYLKTESEARQKVSQAFRDARRI